MNDSQWDTYLFVIVIYSAKFPPREWPVKIILYPFLVYFYAHLSNIGYSDANLSNALIPHNIKPSYTRSSRCVGFVPFTEKYKCFNFLSIAIV